MHARTGMYVAVRIDVPVVVPETWLPRRAVHFHKLIEAVCNRRLDALVVIGPAIPVDGRRRLRGRRRRTESTGNRGSQTKTYFEIAEKRTTGALANARHREHLRA